MAVLHKKEEKIQAVLGRLPKKYTDQQFVDMFIQLYSKDWGKIKAAYIKQSQDKEPGTIINMPKPEVYLKQILDTYLKTVPASIEEKPKEVEAKASAKTTKPKAVVKEKAETPKEIKPKATAKNKAETASKKAKPAK